MASKLTNSASLRNAIKAIGKTRNVLEQRVQEALIGCAYFVMKDRNLSPLNDLRAALGNTVLIDGFNMWVETYMPVILRNERYNVTKAQESMGVTSPETFERYESEMRAAPLWCKMARKQREKSIWEAENYLYSVVDNLRKHGRDDLADLVLALAPKARKEDAPAEAEAAPAEAAPAEAAPAEA